MSHIYIHTHLVYRELLAHGHGTPREWAMMVCVVREAWRGARHTGHPPPCHVVREAWRGARHTGHGPSGHADWGGWLEPWQTSYAAAAAHRCMQKSARLLQRAAHTCESLSTSSNNEPSSRHQHQTHRQRRHQMASASPALTRLETCGPAYLPLGDRHQDEALGYLHMHPLLTHAASTLSPSWTLGAMEHYVGWIRIVESPENTH